MPNSQDQSQPSSDAAAADQNLNEAIQQPSDDSFQGDNSQPSSEAVQEQAPKTSEAPAPTPAPAPAPAAPTQASAPATPKPAVKPPAAPAVKPAPVVTTKSTAAAPAPVAEKKDYADVTGIPEVDRPLKNVPPAHQVGIQRLKEYAEKMHPRRPMEAAEGARLQVALFKVLQNTINKEEQYFRQLWIAILAYFTHEPTGVFKEQNVFRFMDNVALSEPERKAFVRILNLIKVAGPKEGRAVAMKQVDLVQSLRYGLTDEGRQRVTDFFTGAQ